MPLSQVLIDGEDWRLVAEGYQFTEGPAVDGDGNLFFSDVPASRIHKLDVKTGQVSLFAEDTAQTNGLMFGPDGKLYGCRNGDRQIVAYDRDGKLEVVVDGASSNDLVVNSRGGIYFTDRDTKQVWYVPPASGGERGSRQKRVVAEGFPPNGVILWGDEGTLVVTDSNAPHLWAFRVEADGGLKFPERYYTPLVLPRPADPSQPALPGSDGMTIDAQGRLYVATHVGLQVFDPTGRPCGVILKPQPKFLSNVVFAGERLDTLFVTCSDKVYARKTKVNGVRYGAAAR